MQVAIVGAGINGLYLSWKLSEMGYDITVFDRKEKIGDNVVCSGLFSERLLNWLPEAESLIKNKIEYTLIHFPKKTIKVNFSKPFFVINHAELDKLIAKKTKAKIILGKDVKKIPENFNKVIGCDGANSVIRKKLGLKNPKFRLGSLKIERGRASFNFVDVWPCRTGFSWKIPRGDSMEIGQISSFSEIRKEPGFIFKVIPQGLVVPKNNNITLCGDATGLTKPWSGGGVIWQLTMADILLKTFPDFKKYRKMVKLKMGSNLFLGETVCNLIYFFGFNFPLILPKNIKMGSDFLIK